MGFPLIAFVNNLFSLDFFLNLLYISPATGVGTILQVESCS